MLNFSKSVSLAAIALAVMVVGCAGPEQKLGRGMRNATEVVRLGELRRSMEQTAIWESPERSYTTGLIQGVNQTVKRTAVGLYEIVTFPVPDHGLGDYSPAMVSDEVVYPDNFTPNLLSDSTYATDTALGFSGGDALPIVGSRFRVFDY
jgi:putative exosortase-associated protein (TIGR04073 family)